MDPSTKDAIDAVSTLVGIAVATWGIWKGLDSARKAVAEKQVENRHKQLSAARSMMAEVFADPLARSAMRMLDWSGRTYLQKDATHIVHDADLPAALELHGSGRLFTEKEAFIRDCFEAFFDHLLVIKHFIDQGYLNVSDIAVPLRYYAVRIENARPTFKSFMTYGYSKVETLLEDLAKS